MRIIWQQLGVPSLWPLPLLLGLTLIGIGVLIILFPALLAYAVAAMFITTGISLLGVALGMRGSVRYRQINPAWRGGEPERTVIVEGPRV